MSDLKSRIAGLIGSEGPISIAQYMTMALHDSREGYYAARPAIGGDFITAPEVSQMFGELIGLWIVQCWRDCGSPSPARLVELGPGRGTLMEDALRAARVVPEFLEAIEIVLVEASPLLRGMQQEKFSPFARVRWLDHFDSDALSDRPLFLIANEFFDALPIRQYVKTARGWCERMVAAENGELKFVLAPIPMAGLRMEADNGAVHEASPASTALAAEISRIIAAKGGAALMIDYGHDGGFGDTLQAVAQHKYASILDAPGEADLSAHVDFGALAAAAKRGGARVFGPAPQGEFLTALGITERARRLGAQGELARLVSAGQMGTLFKALAILPNGSTTPPGFQC